MRLNSLSIFEMGGGGGGGVVVFTKVFDRHFSRYQTRLQQPQANQTRTSDELVN